jgi:hypothetical protein
VIVRESVQRTGASTLPLCPESPSRLPERTVHLHDLGGSGLTLAAQLGATTAELMFRAGHKSFASAMRYQHASADRDRMIAERMAEAAKSARVASTEAEALADVVSL